MYIYKAFTKTKCLGLLDTQFFLLDFQDGSLDTLVLGKRHHGRGSLANDKHVSFPGGKGCSSCIGDPDDFNGSRMFLSALDNPDASLIASADDHSDVTRVKLDEIGDLVLLQIEHDGIVYLDERVWVPNGTSVMGGDILDASRPYLLSDDLAELVFSLLGADTMKGESALDVVQEPEDLIGLFELDDVHES